MTSCLVIFRLHSGGQRGQGMDDVLRHIDVPWPLEKVNLRVPAESRDC